MPDVLQDKFDVVVDGDTYTFRIPGIKFDLESSYRAADVRRKAFPEGMGAIGGLDTTAFQFSRCCAFLELYLDKATTTWPYGLRDGEAMPDVPPKVDHEKFPRERLDSVYGVGDAFEAEVGRFLGRRDTRVRPAGT